MCLGNAPQCSSGKSTATRPAGTIPSSAFDRAAGFAGDQCTTTCRMLGKCTSENLVKPADLVTLTFFNMFLFGLACAVFDFTIKKCLDLLHWSEPQTAAFLKKRQQRKPPFPGHFEWSISINSTSLKTSPAFAIVKVSHSLRINSLGHGPTTPMPSIHRIQVLSVGAESWTFMSLGKKKRNAKKRTWNQVFQKSSKTFLKPGDRYQPSVASWARLTIPPASKSKRASKEASNQRTNHLNDPTQWQIIANKHQPKKRHQSKIIIFKRIQQRALCGFVLQSSSHINALSTTSIAQKWFETSASLSVWPPSLCPSPLESCNCRTKTLSPSVKATFVVCIVAALLNPNEAAAHLSHKRKKTPLVPNMFCKSFLWFQDFLY